MFATEDTLKKFILTAVMALAFGPAAYGQSACGQLGMPACAPPHPSGGGSSGGGGSVGGGGGCDEECRQHNREIDERNAERKQEEKERKARNKVIEKANKFALKAWELIKDDQHEDCARAIPLYRQALALDNFPQWTQNVAYCYGKLGQPLNQVQEERKMYLDSRTDPEERKRIRWRMWSLLYDAGYSCPTYIPISRHDDLPSFDGTLKGCVGTPLHNRIPTYVPLPVIDGASWKPLNVMYSSVGALDIQTKDGHRYGSYTGNFNILEANLMDAQVRTGDNTSFRVTLPDGHDFAIGPNSDITLDKFVYDPNQSYTEMAVENLKGIFRWVTAKMARPDPQQIKVKLPVGDLFIRGTDVEIIHGRQDPGGKDSDPNIWCIYAYSGDVEFTDTTGKVTKILMGNALVIGDGPAGMGTNVAHRPVLNNTDSWDMPTN